MQEVTYDVVVVGAGGAGLKAAVTCKEKYHELKVAVVVKEKLGKCGCTALSCSDRMAFHATLPQTEPGGEDNWKHHARDIYRIGGEVSDGDLAVILAKNSGRVFQYLLELGVPFARRDDGTIDQFVTDGSKYARACYTGPRTANHIEEALVKKSREMAIDIHEDTLAYELLPDEKKERIAGILAWKEAGHEPPGGLILFRTKAVILATGGAGGAYQVNCFPPRMTGDGQAMVWRRGGELVNMEFIQIGLSSVKTRLACSGSIMRAIPRFVNEQGTEFLKKYFAERAKPAEIHDVVFRKGASWPVSCEEPSHIIDIAVYQENAAGRTVYLDFGTNPEGFQLEELEENILAWYRREKRVNTSDLAVKNSPLARLQKINAPAVEWLKERGIDLARGDVIEIAPAIQHFQGGIKIRTRAETTLPGAYACGECAGGQHGANRPGGNALMDSQVFGEIAGISAGGEARKLKALPAVDREGLKVAEETVRRLPEEKSRPPVTKVRQRIRALMSRCGSVVRTEEILKQGLEELGRIKAEGVSCGEKEIGVALETLNIMEAGEIVLRACLSRKESRGPHLFFARPTDIKPLPRDDERGSVYNVLRKEGDKVVVERRQPVPLKI